MSTEATNHVSDATELFERRRYAECMYSALEALGIYEEEEHWLMASATLVLYGRCSNAVGAYLQANNAFRQALRLLRKVKHTDAEAAIITAHIQQSNGDEVSKDELERLHDQVEACVAKFDFDRADELCAKELERAARNCSPRDWYVAMLKVVQVMTRVGRANAMLDGDGDGVDEAMAMFEECRRLYDEALAIAGQPENLERAHWLVAFIEKKRAQVDSVIKAGREVSQEASEFSQGEYTGESQDACDARPPARRATRGPRQLHSWTEVFHDVNVQLIGSGRLHAAMAPADDLFIRGEYRQCIGQVYSLVAKAKKQGNWVLMGMGLVLIGRCQRALGLYEDAGIILEDAALYLRRGGSVGARMCASIARLQKSIAADEAVYAKLNEVFGRCQTLAENGQFADAADLASHGLRRQSSHLGAQHWVCGSFKALKGDYLIQRRRATVCGVSPRDRDADESVVDEVRTLLKEADAIVTAHGHDAAWVGATVRRVRDNLYQLCDEAGL